MFNQKTKIPNKEGLEEVRRRLKELRRKAPSPELVKIIEEVTHQDSVPKSDSDDGIAARPTNQPHRDLDF